MAGNKAKKLKYLYFKRITNSYIHGWRIANSPERRTAGNGGDKRSANSPKRENYFFIYNKIFAICNLRVFLIQQQT